MSGAVISPEAMDRYFDRQARIGAAQAHPCPSCGVAATERCTDRWGWPTSFTHTARNLLIGWTTDPYALYDNEVPRG